MGLSTAIDAPLRRPYKPGKRRGGMETAFGWLGQIVSTLLEFIPRMLIVRQTHAGVRFRFGSHVSPILPTNGVRGTGIHVYWPIVTEVEIIPVKRQPTNLSAQRLMTADGVTVGVGGIIVYEVEDVVKVLTSSWAYDETIRDLGMAAIKHVVAANNFAFFSTDPQGADLALTTQLSQDLESIGIRVLRVTLSDFAPCFVYTQLT